MARLTAVLDAKKGNFIRLMMLSCYRNVETISSRKAERKNTMKNIEIREAIEKKRLRHYEVAAALGVHPASFSRWLYQSELTGDKKRRILDAIKRIK